MRNVLILARREFAAYFAGSLATVFLIVFVGGAGALTFFVGRFVELGQASLVPFFSFDPWLFLVLIPAIGMRLWAEERRAGTVEFLLTMPVSTAEAVLGKFLAAWAFAGLALVLTFPLVLTVNFLGRPDNGVILTSYLGSFLLAGGLLAMACCVSALTANQVTAFVLGVTAALLLLVASHEAVIAPLSAVAPHVAIELVSALSLSRHYEAVTRGVIEASDLVFFLSMIALFLFINCQILDTREVTRRLFAVPMAVVLFVAVNVAATLKLDRARLDVTDRSLFTLSEGSRAVVAAVPEPIALRLFQTRELIDAVPALQTSANEVLQLLRTFERTAGGRIRLGIVETRPFSAEEDQALGFGLDGFNLDRSGERGYFGLVGTNSLDGLETIPFLDPARQSLLQYDLTRVIHRLSQPAEPRVTVLDGLAMYGSRQAGRGPRAILTLLGEDFRLQAMPADRPEVPPGTDVLVVAHPATLTPAQEFAIDQYVLGGGAALVFLDPLAENSPPDPANPNRPADPSSDLAPLLAAWGVAMDPGKVVGDRDLAMETVGVAGTQRVVADYLPWLRVDGAALNAGEPIVARLRAMRLSSAGAIRTLPGATTAVTTLLQSTPHSMLFERDEVMRRPNPNALLETFEPAGARLPLAVRVTGPARTAFPEGRPADAAALPGTPEPLAEGSIDVILVADTDVLADSHVVGSDGRLTTSNADFVLNAVGDLAGGDSLVGVRGGGEISRPFTAVEAIRDKAEATYRATEQRLSQELADIQQKLLQLQGPRQAGGGSALKMSREQQRLVAEYNGRIAEVRARLRDVRQALRAEIESLERGVEIVNIAVVPLLLLLATVIVGLWRAARIRRHLRAHGGGSAR